MKSTFTLLWLDSMQRRLSHAVASISFVRHQTTPPPPPPSGTSFNSGASSSESSSTSPNEEGGDGKHFHHQRFLAAVKDRNFSEAQSYATVFIQQRWKPEYNLPALAVLVCAMVWYWIAWTLRSVKRKCQALEATVEKEVHELEQMMTSMSEKWRREMAKASGDMKLMMAKNSELTADIDRMTTALRRCHVRPVSS